MNQSTAQSELKNKYNAIKTHFENEIKKMRTGRANSSMLDGLVVEAYGQKMPIISLATISVPEPQLIQVSPFDPSNLQAIVSSIRANSNLGLNPVDDGRVIRLSVPPLTEERRLALVKELGSIKEHTMISLRQARHEILNAVDAAKKAKEIGEDDQKRTEKSIDQDFEKFKIEIDTISKEKELSLLKI